MSKLTVAFWPDEKKVMKGRCITAKGQLVIGDW
jgi:hypothetical protein